MKILPRNIQLSMAAALLLLFAIPAFSQGGKAPIQKDRLLKALELNGFSVRELVEQIRSRGVAFRMTPADEAELRRAGAGDEVIAAVRDSFRADSGGAGAYAPPSGGRNSPGRVPTENGDQLYAQGRYAEAAAAYEQAIRLDPDYPAAHSGAGIAYTALRRYAEAVAAFEKAIRLAPQDPAAYAQLGFTYQEMGNYLDALGALKQAVRLKSDYADAYGFLSLVYDRLDRHQESLDAASELVRLKPDAAAGHNRMAYAYNQLGRWQEALAEAQRVLELGPTPGSRAFAYYNMGNAYLGMKVGPKALDSFRRAVETYDQSPELKPDAYFYKGNSLQQLGRLQDAIECYRKAVEMRPSFVQAHLSLGLAYAAAGNKRAAMDEYNALKIIDAARADRLLKVINIRR